MPHHFPTCLAVYICGTDCVPVAVLRDFEEPAGEFTRFRYGFKLRFWARSPWRPMFAYVSAPVVLRKWLRPDSRPSMLVARFRAQHNLGRSTQTIELFMLCDGCKRASTRSCRGVAAPPQRPNTHMRSCCPAFIVLPRTGNRTPDKLYQCLRATESRMMGFAVCTLIRAAMLPSVPCCTRCMHLYASVCAQPPCCNIGNWSGCS